MPNKCQVFKKTASIGVASYSTDKGPSNSPAGQIKNIKQLSRKKLIVAAILAALATSYIYNQSLTQTEFDATVYGTMFTTKAELQTKLTQKANALCGTGNYVILNQKGDAAKVSERESVKLHALSAKIQCI